MQDMKLEKYYKMQKIKQKTLSNKYQNKKTKTK